MPEEIIEYRLPIGPLITELFVKEAASGKGFSEALTSAKAKAKDIMRDSHIRLTGVSVDVDLLLIAIGLTKSRSEAKRLIKQGTIKVDGVTLKEDDSSIEPKDGRIIQRGNRRVRLVNANK